MGNACSIFFHPTAASVDLADLVLLLGNVETKTGDFLFFFRRRRALQQPGKEKEGVLQQPDKEEILGCWGLV
jgi:hypothetical protein